MSLNSENPEAACFACRKCTWINSVGCIECAVCGISKLESSPLRFDHWICECRSLAQTDTLVCISCGYGHAVTPITNNNSHDLFDIDDLINMQRQNKQDAAPSDFTLPDAVSTASNRVVASTGTPNRGFGKKSIFPWEHRETKSIESSVVDQAKEQKHDAPLNMITKIDAKKDINNPFYAPNDHSPICNEYPRYERSNWIYKRDDIWRCFSITVAKMLENAWNAKILTPFDVPNNGAMCRVEFDPKNPSIASQFNLLTNKREEIKRNGTFVHSCLVCETGKVCVELEESLSESLISPIETKIGPSTSIGEKKERVESGSTLEALEAEEALEAVEAVEALKVVEAVEAVEKAARVEVVEAAEAAKAVEAVEEAARLTEKARARARAKAAARISIPISEIKNNCELLRQINHKKNTKPKNTGSFFHAHVGRKIQREYKSDEWRINQSELISKYLSEDAAKIVLAYMDSRFLVCSIRLNRKTNTIFWRVQRPDCTYIEFQPGDKPTDTIEDARKALAQIIHYPVEMITFGFAMDTCIRSCANSEMLAAWHDHIDWFDITIDGYTYTWAKFWHATDTKAETEMRDYLEKFTQNLNLQEAANKIALQKTKSQGERKAINKANKNKKSAKIAALMDKVYRKGWSLDLSTKENKNSPTSG